MDESLRDLDLKRFKYGEAVRKGWLSLLAHNELQVTMFVSSAVGGAIGHNISHMNQTSHSSLEYHVHTVRAQAMFV